MAKEEDNAAKIIQNLFKIAIAKRELHNLRLKNLEILERQKEAKYLALKVQGMWRQRKARKNIRNVIASLYIKEFDDGPQEWYYINTLTGKMQWKKPILLGELFSCQLS